MAVGSHSSGSSFFYLRTLNDSHNLNFLLLLYTPFVNNKDLICSASKEKSEENYWVAGLNMNKLFCIVCKSPDLFPPVR